MDPILVMTDEEARDLKAKGLKAKETGMASNLLPLTKYRQRMRQLQEKQKTSDVPNSTALSQDAFEFLNETAENYLGLASSSSSSSSSSDNSNATPNVETEPGLNETDYFGEEEPSIVMQSEALELEEFLVDVSDVGQDEVVLDEVVLISSEEANEILESMSHLDP